MNVHALYNAYISTDLEVLYVSQQFPCVTVGAQPIIEHHSSIHNIRLIGVHTRTYVPVQSVCVPEHGKELW